MGEQLSGEANTLRAKTEVLKFFSLEANQKPAKLHWTVFNQWLQIRGECFFNLIDIFLIRDFYGEG